MNLKQLQNSKSPGVRLKKEPVEIKPLEIQTPKQGKSQSESPKNRNFKNSIFSPSNNLLKEKEISLDISEKPKSPIIKSIIRQSFPLKQPPQLKELNEIGEEDIKSLDNKGHFVQRMQLKKISKIILEQNAFKEKNSPEKKNKMEISSVDRNISPLKIKENPLENFQKTINKQTTVMIPKEEAEKLSSNLISDDRIQMISENYEQNYYHRISNIGGNKLDQFFEKIEEVPTAVKSNEFFITPLSQQQISKKQSVQNISRYKTLEENLEDEFSQTQFTKFLLKYNKIFLYFLKGQDPDTISEYKYEISQDQNFYSKMNMLLYILFNLVVALCWIIINEKIEGFKGFFPTRILTIVFGLAFTYYWKKENVKEYQKPIILLFYSAIIIQIFVFSSENDTITIVQELEILAFYLSLTSFPFFNFIEILLMSGLFLIAHYSYIVLTVEKMYLMLHSSIVVTFFNVASAHIRIKISIDRFNSSRVNIIKKKQLNNLVANLLPNHVSFDYFHFKLQIF